MFGASLSMLQKEHTSEQAKNNFAQKPQRTYYEMSMIIKILCST